MKEEGSQICCNYGLFLVPQVEAIWERTANFSVEMKGQRGALYASELHKVGDIPKSPVGHPTSSASHTGTQGQVGTGGVFVDKWLSLCL